MLSEISSENRFYVVQKSLNIFCFVYMEFFTLLSFYLKESTLFCMGVQDKDGIPSAKKKLKVTELLSAT